MTFAFVFIKHKYFWLAHWIDNEDQSTTTASKYHDNQLEKLLEYKRF